MSDAQYLLHPVGFVRSSLKRREDAPRQGNEGAPDAWIDIDAAFAVALQGTAVGDDVIVISWFHQADRDILKVHPRDDLNNPLTGIFATRSSDRPNPLGLHRVKVLEIVGTSLRVAPLEAIDGTPIVDIKPVLSPSER
jgi:tRNA-Thr(GGU) m(6)t(6)A37 methyltransferase TsaA